MFNSLIISINNSPIPSHSRKCTTQRNKSYCCRASASSEAKLALDDILAAIDGTDRGLKTSASAQTEIKRAVEALSIVNQQSKTTAPELLSATWKLMWTTEKETLFILEKAGLFGTEAGDVYQTISEKKLCNIITFPPDGAFIVDSDISIAGDQRVDFKFNAAKLNLPNGKSIPFPPFGKGWFDNIYVDETYRVAKDSRNDILVTIRDGDFREF